MTCRSFMVEYFPPANTYPWRSIDKGSGRLACVVTLAAAPTASTSATVNARNLLSASLMEFFPGLMSVHHTRSTIAPSADGCKRLLGCPIRGPRPLVDG